MLVYIEGRLVTYQYNPQLRKDQVHIRAHHKHGILHMLTNQSTEKAFQLGTYVVAVQFKLLAQ